MIMEKEGGMPQPQRKKWPGRSSVHLHLRAGIYSWLTNWWHIHFQETANKIFLECRRKTQWNLEHPFIWNSGWIKRNPEKPNHDCPSGWLWKEADLTLLWSRFRNNTAWSFNSIAEVPIHPKIPASETNEKPIHSFSSVLRRAFAFVIRMLSCLARDTISFRFRAEVALAISAQ